MAKKAKTKDTFNGTTHVMFVLDESGSMTSIWDSTISGFNEWLGTMQRAGGDVRFTLIKFDTEYRPLEENVPIGEVKELDRERYSPNANTALYDAIGHCVKVVEGDVGEKDRALVVILTDGQENSSREMTRASIEEMIKEREGKGNWSFTYLSAHPNAFADSAALGITRGNTATFSATPSGMRRAMGMVGQSTANYTAGAASATASFYGQDDADAEKAKVSRAS